MEIALIRSPTTVVHSCTKGGGGADALVLQFCGFGLWSLDAKLQTCRVGRLHIMMRAFVSGGSPTPYSRVDRIKYIEGLLLDFFVLYGFTWYSPDPHRSAAVLVVCGGPREVLDVYANQEPRAQWRMLPPLTLTHESTLIQTRTEQELGGPSQSVKCKEHMSTSHRWAHTASVHTSVVCLSPRHTLLSIV